MLTAAAVAPATAVGAGVGADDDGAELGLLWLFLTYAFFASVAAHEHKPQPMRSLNGSWLLAVVATQSVSLLGAIVAP